MQGKQQDPHIQYVPIATATADIRAMTLLHSRTG